MEEIYEQLPLIKENPGKSEGLRKFLEEKKLDNIYSSISEKRKNFIFYGKLLAPVSSRQVERIAGKYLV